LQLAILGHILCFPSRVTFDYKRAEHFPTDSLPVIAEFLLQ
jgi:hypothetical protein